MDVDDGGHKSRRLLLAGLLAFVVLAAAGLLIWRQTARRSAGVLPPGNEVEVAKMNPYGWSASLAVGTRFTDGLNFIPVSPTAKGPLRLCRCSL